MAGANGKTSIGIAVFSLVIVLFIGGLVAFLIVGSIATADYRSEAEDEDTHVIGWCRTYAIGTDFQTCSCGKHCSYTCFSGFWNIYVYEFEDYDPAAPGNSSVVYDDSQGVLSGINTGSTNDDEDDMYQYLETEHPVGSVHQCYYNSNKPTDARWSEPDADHERDLMIAMWVMFFVCCVVGIIFIGATAAFMYYAMRN
eukprot:TRINITY_DN1166_c0_g1_i8.p1 TRINITY_DN1166_c0_g1~~TRINITY_DN1166_c0_g1_i8.p1  ORF type:complete len:216 (-),score=31.28 TRINITY_DN1166_c0_g1_i8:138-731(-)